jgi:hypothetical protein
MQSKTLLWERLRRKKGEAMSIPYGTTSEYITVVCRENRKEIEKAADLLYNDVTPYSDIAVCMAFAETHRTMPEGTGVQVLGHMAFRMARAWCDQGGKPGTEQYPINVGDKVKFNYASEDGSTPFEVKDLKDGVARLEPGLYGHKDIFVIVADLCLVEGAHGEKV